MTGLRQWMGWIGAAALAAGALAGEVAEIPRHEMRQGMQGGYGLGCREVTVGEFVEYLNAAGAEYPDTAQIWHRRDGRPEARRGVQRQAVAEVTAEEAEAYCRWRAGREGRVVRLPTEAEWETAARGGLDGAPYPWGWGAEPGRMAQFDAKGPAARGGLFPANGFGLFDMAGNVYEWCRTAVDEDEGQRIARGGAWSERDPATLRVDHRQVFPAGYRGRDVGFRVLVESGGEEAKTP